MLAVLRQRDFALLWLAGLISITGDTALIIALPLHIYRLTGSTLATAAAFASSFLPRILFGSIVGVFVDRWDRKRTMIVADLTRAAALLLVLVAPDRLAMLYTVAAIQGMIGLFFTPAENALLPTLVGQDRLVPANALNSLNNNLGFLIGPALGALLYAETGIAGAALVDVVSFVGSALLIGFIAADARPPYEPGSFPEGASAWKRAANDWRAGMSVVQRDRALRVLFVAICFAAVAEGIFLTLGLSPLVLDVLGGSPAQVGWLGTAQAIGGMIASVLVARAGYRMTKRWLVASGMIGVGLADLATANARLIAAPGTPAVGVAMGWMVLAGFPSVAGVTGRHSLVQSQVSDAYRGRVFASMGAVQGLAMMVGFAIGGLLGNAVGLVLMLSVGACVRVLGGVVAMVFLPKQEPSLPITAHPDSQAERAGFSSPEIADSS